MTIRESYCSWRTLGIGALTLAASLALAAPVSGQSGPAVTSLTLINADTEQPIAGFNPLPATAPLNLATLPTRNLNIRANIAPGGLKSRQRPVRVRRSEQQLPDGNGVPYAFAGETNGNYAPFTPTVGSHTVRATAYTKSNARGPAGPPLQVTLQVTDSPGGPAVTASR